MMDHAMSLVSIALRRGKTAAYRKAVADAVHEALVEVIGIPREDRVQLITPLDDDALIYGHNYPGPERSEDIVIIQITLRAGRSRHARLTLHRNIVARLAADLGIQAEDVVIVLSEADHANLWVGRSQTPIIMPQEVYDEL